MTSNNAPRVAVSIVGDAREVDERTHQDYLFLRDMVGELASSRTEHPLPDACLAALSEELGEVAKAMLDEAPGRVRAECLQLASTALRLAVEGDPTMASTRKRRRGRRDSGGALA